jgi:hypothetical protein
MPLELLFELAVGLRRMHRRRRGALFPVVVHNNLNPSLLACNEQPPAPFRHALLSTGSGGASANRQAAVCVARILRHE